MVKDLDLAATLRAVGAEDEAAAVVDAGFFHRTLARWLGLPEGQSPVSNPVRWEYGFWKATFEPQPNDGDKEVFAADLFRTRDGPVERVSWFVKKDARGRILEAGWLSEAPKLVDEAPVVEEDAPTLDDDTLARLLDDETEA